MLSALCIMPSREAKVDQRIQVNVCNRENVATATSVATIWTSKFLVFLVPERNTACSSVSSGNVYVRLVNELHNAGTYKRKTPRLRRRVISEK